MPTYGTNYEEYEERQLGDRGTPPSRPEPPSFDCPVCSHTVGDSVELAAHVADKHPLSPPRLVLGGELVVGECVVRRPLKPRDVALASTTEVEILDPLGSREVDEAELRRLLSGDGSGRHRVRLHSLRDADGAHVHEDVLVILDIPDPSDLDLVDGAFASCLVDDRLDRAALAEFDSSTQAIATGRAYAAALYDYCVGVRARDGEALDPEELDREGARAKLQGALSVLRHYSDRPLARAVGGFIRFTLNDFGDWMPTGVADLDACAAVLADAAGSGGLPDVAIGTSERARCPADETTAEILHQWSGGSHDPEPFLDLVGRGELSAEDRAKGAVLALVAAGDSESIAPLGYAARSIVHDLDFGAFAAGWLSVHGEAA